MGKWGTGMRPEGFLEVRVMSQKNKCGLVRQMVKKISPHKRSSMNRGMWKRNNLRSMCLVCVCGCVCICVCWGEEVVFKDMGELETDPSS